MTKIQGLLRSILILCLFLSTNIKKAEAFGWLPPLPPEPVVDFPDEGGKVVSVAQAAYQKVQSIDSKLATLRLDAIKKGDLFALKELLSTANALTEGGKKKSPNKGTVQPNSDLKITNDNKGLLDEEAFFNAHNALFFTYPSIADYQSMFPEGEADYSFMRTIYEGKAAKYRQDMLIDTYLTARVMEDYLVTVERTLNRLDKCQKEPDPEKCTFFGMTMAKVESKEEAPQPGDNNNPGQMGAATNAYIVTMVYDRLMRIVEDLTATEALYQSAKQTDMADPVYPKANESNAADYVPQKYHFAYSKTHEHSYAKGLINSDGFNRLKCNPGEKGCPASNNEAKAKKLMDDTEILTKLQPLDNILTEAITIHNIKNQLPSYKVQYRKYLRAIENHKRALQAVYDSDQCIVKFFMRHGADTVIDPITHQERKRNKEEWDGFWGTPKGRGEQPTEDGHVFKYEKDYNNYESRGGYSLELIKEYQARTENTILGTSSECENYYAEGQCADGYKSDTDHPCAADKTLYPCVLENAVEFDANTPSSVNTDNMQDSLDGGVEKLADNQKGSLSFDEKDYVASNTDIENIVDDNRVRTETPWRIGAEKVVEMTGRTDGFKILFYPWNDQKGFQVEYLRQKYHNIGNIIKTTDKGWASFKITQSLSENPDPNAAEDAEEAKLQQAIKSLVNGGRTCLSVDDAVVKARNEICSGYPSDQYECNVEGDASTGIIHYEIITKGQEATFTSREEVTEGTDTLEEDETLEEAEERICGDYEDEEDITCSVEEGEEEGEISYTITETIKEEATAAVAGGEVVASGDKKQYASETGPQCEYTNSGTFDFEITPSGGMGCNDTWDLTKGFLVKRYLRCLVAEDADKFYSDAKGKGRRVARNKLAEVMWTRKGTDIVMKETVNDYNLKIEALESKLAKTKELMTSYNKLVDSAIEEKNLIQKLKDKSEKRIKSIEDEIASITEREAKVNIQSDKCAMDYRKAKLNHEMNCIKSGTGNFACPASCAGLKEAQKPEGCRDASKIPTCYNPDNGYVINLSEAMEAQKKFDAINTLNNQKSAEEEALPVPAEVKKAINKYIKPSEVDPALKERDRKVETAQNQKKALQEEVNKQQEKIDEVATKFMSEEGKHFNEVYKDKVKLEKYVWNKGSKTWTLAGYNEVTREQASYIVTAIAEQEKIEKDNSEFESFLEATDEDQEADKARMYDENREHCVKSIPIIGCVKHESPTGVGSDNLTSTLNYFFDDGAEQEPIYNNMKAKWFNEAFFNQFGDNKFTIDASFDILGLPSGEITLKEAVKKAAEKIVELAAKKMVENIRKGDKIITTEMDEAAKDIRKLTKEFGIGEEDTTPDTDAIINHSNYQDWNGKRLDVKNKHIDLITQLRDPHANKERLAKAGIEMAKLYGIPDGIEKICGTSKTDNDAHKDYCGRPTNDETNDKYFVALPARGYIEAEDYATDDFAGKDFMQPNGPLPYLPPVREVFYFDAQDYEDLPRQDDNRPSIPHLLNKKFPEHPDGFVSSWEYMPEIWRYILARPNMRNDGMYQKAFVERGYDAGKLQEITEGAPGSGIDVANYGKIIGREGVYPCKLVNNNTVIDVWANDSVDGLTFIHGDGLSAENTCKEIALNQDKHLKGAIADENVCYLYNKDRRGSYHFCHFLADHGGEEPKDTHTANGTGSMPEFREYGELGQFLRTGSVVKFAGMSIPVGDSNMYYRDMQVSIAKYLTDEDNAENSIKRQVAELSSFKRNVFGSFLNTVYIEHSAKKTRDNMRKTVLDSLAGLCKQIHQNGKSISSQLNDEGYKDGNEKARDEMDKACAKYLTDGEGEVGSEGYAVGLAFSKVGERDTQYGVNEEFTKDQDLYGGISCGRGSGSSYYENIFCKLDEIKEDKLAEAKRLRQEAQKIYDKLINKEGDKKYVDDRLADIDDYIAMLETDQNEVVFLTPNMKKGEKDATKAYIEGEVDKEKANRTVERSTDEESITGMDNGTQAVPYCPTY